MHRWLLAVTLAVATAVTVAPALAGGDDDRREDDRDRGGRNAIVKRPVTFTVQNVNRSLLPCATDGREYRIRGHIVGPRGGLRNADAATLYLHGLEAGEFFWTQEAYGASFVERQARDGHVSVVIDRLGYDSSGKPDGFQSCLGGQADIANQIVDQLRDGDYAVGGRRSAPSFEQVVLGGHSVGGLLTELTAISFDNVDGIIVASYSDTVLSDAAKAAAAANARMCAAGGTRTEGGAFPGGYAPFAPTLAGFQAAFFLSATPDLVDATSELRNLNPCGDTGTFMAGAQTNVRFIGQIKVPVLVIIGEEDALFPPPAGPTQAALFTGTQDVTLRTLSPSSHAVTVEQTAPQFSRQISRWLDDHGFGRGERDRDSDDR